MAGQEAQARDLYNEARRGEAEAGAAPESAELADMRRQLETVERQLENLTVANASGNIRQQLEKARDDLRAKMQAVSFAEPTAPEKSAQRVLPGMPVAMRSAVPAERFG